MSISSNPIGGSGGGGGGGAITENVTVNVPTDYSTINEAIEYLTEQYPRADVSATINLEAGFTMAEQVLIENGKNLGWIVITGADTQTTVTNTALTVAMAESGTNRFPAFGAKNGCVLPRISQLFRMDTQSNTKTGILVTGGSSVFIDATCGFEYAGYGLIVGQGSTAEAYDTEWDYSNLVGVYLNGGKATLVNSSIRLANGKAVQAYNSEIDLGGADLDASDGRPMDATSCKIDAVNISIANANTASLYIFLDNCVANFTSCDVSFYNNTSGFQFNVINSILNLDSATLVNNNGSCIKAQRSTVVNARRTDCTAGSGANEYEVYEGSTININSALGDTATNVTVNTVTANGIIFQ